MFQDLVTFNLATQSKSAKLFLYSLFSEYGDNLNLRNLILI